MQRDPFSVKEFPALSEYVSDNMPRGLRVCIATEEIIGPVRNGGIASTYYHMARGLARQGHSVTVLYLKGQKVENETPEHWEEHYKSFGIDLVYLPLPDDVLVCASDFWQRRYLGMYRWLKEQPAFDVVHTSEWRGGAYYSLMMKRMGLAFQDTLFIVKTSSPHIWNRHYQMRPITKSSLITAAFAEQKCVEWADIVVGGSAHLITFMQQIGYKVDDAKTYVQPNIIDFDEVVVTDLRRELSIGETVNSGDIVFFGRLESRKGLELFCNALDLLLYRGITPKHVTFLGKEGDLLANYDNIKPLAFIEERQKHWPFPVEVVDDKNQPEALSFLCESEKIAVMPSLIENSTMAVYEALEHRIPFIATRVGGTPELVREADRDAVLIDPTVHALAERLETVLANGQIVAGAAYDNEANLATWYAFHRFLSDQVEKHGMAHVQHLLRRDGQKAELDVQPSVDSLALVVCQHGDAAQISALLDSIEKLDSQPDQVIVCATRPDALEELAGRQFAGACPVQLVDCLGLTAGGSFNEIQNRHPADALVFCTHENVRFYEDFFPTIRQSLKSAPDSLHTTAFMLGEDEESGKNGQLVLPMGGDVASEYIGNRAYGSELLAMTSELFDRLGVFEDYDIQAGVIHEYVTRAALTGHDYMVLPDDHFLLQQAIYPAPEDNPNYQYLRMKRALDSSPLPLKKILLYYLNPHQEKTSRTASGSNLGPEENFRCLWRVDQGAAAKEPLRRGDFNVFFDSDTAKFFVSKPDASSCRLLVNSQLISVNEEPSRVAGLSVFEFAIPEHLLEAGGNGVEFQLSAWGKMSSRWLNLRVLGQGVRLVTARKPVYPVDQLSVLTGSKNRLALPRLLGALPQATLAQLRSLSGPSSNDGDDAIDETAFNIAYDPECSVLYAACPNAPRAEMSVNRELVGVNKLPGDHAFLSIFEFPLSNEHLALGENSVELKVFGEKRNFIRQFGVLYLGEGVKLVSSKKPLLSMSQLEQLKRKRGEQQLAARQLTYVLNHTAELPAPRKRPDFFISFDAQANCLHANVAPELVGTDEPSCSVRFNRYSELPIPIELEPELGVYQANLGVVAERAFQVGHLKVEVIFSANKCEHTRTFQMHTRGEHIVVWSQRPVLVPRRSLLVRLAEAIGR